MSLAQVGSHWTRGFPSQSLCSYVEPYEKMNLRLWSSSALHAFFYWMNTQIFPLNDLSYSEVGSVRKGWGSGRVWSLGREAPLEKEMAAHSSILAWEIPWTEDPGGLQSMESWRVRHDWTHRHAEAMAAYHCGYVKCHWIVPFKMVHFLLREFHFSFFFVC